LTTATLARHPLDLLYQRTLLCRLKRARYALPTLQAARCHYDYWPRAIHGQRHANADVHRLLNLIEAVEFQLRARMGWFDKARPHISCVRLLTVSPLRANAITPTMPYDRLGDTRHELIAINPVQPADRSTTPTRQHDTVPNER